jgi:hypothetical protein
MIKMKDFAVVLAGLILALGVGADDEHHALRGGRHARVLLKDVNGRPSFVTGNLGQVGVAVHKQNEK